MQEEWRDIIGFDGKYQVSNLGNVKSTDRYYKQANAKTSEYEHIYKGKVLTPFYTKWGYKRIGLSQNGKVKFYTIHKLVAETFIPNPENLPCVNHKDGNKENNNVNNLEWCTYQDNNRHARKTGLNKGNKGISYKNRCLKAIEYIKKHCDYGYAGQKCLTDVLYRYEAEELLEILQGKSDE